MVRPIPTSPKLSLKSLFNRLLIFCGLTLLSGCLEPTYPAERIIQSVKKLCQEEYGLDAQARVLGTTLGAAIHLAGLVDEELKLAKDAAKKIEHLALSMRRVILSTDRPLDFYIVCARDTKTPGAEYVMSSCTRDVKKATLQGLSRGEYLARLQRDFHFNPQVLGRPIIAHIFAELNGQGQHLAVLAKYTRIPISAQKIQQIFYPAFQLAQPQTIRYQIVDIQSKEIPGQQALFWVRTRQFYTPKSEQANSLFSPGFRNEYLIRTDVASPTQPIVEIVPQFFPQENLIQERQMHKVFAQYEDIALLDEQGLPIKEIKLKDFLSRQIARRLKEKLQEERFQDQFQISAIRVAFDADSLKLEFNIAGDEQVILEQALTLISNTLETYDVQDIASVEITAQATGTKMQIPRPSLNQSLP